jgi:hypothetical protein
MILIYTCAAGAVDAYVESPPEGVKHPYITWFETVRNAKLHVKCEWNAIGMRLNYIHKE